LKLLRYLLFLGILVTGAVWLADHPGEVAVEWLQWRLETNVPVLLALLLLLAGGLFYSLRAVSAILRVPHHWRLRRREKGFQALTEGLAAVAGGQTRRAGKLARRAEKLLNSPHLTRLLSAQSATLQGDKEQMRAHFEAMRDNKATALAGLRGLLDLEEDYDKAIALAREARKLAPADEALAERLFALLVRRDLLAEAQDLVGDAQRHKAYGKQKASRRRALLLNEKAQQADGDEAFNFAKLAVSNDPTFADAALRLAGLMAARGQVRQAGAVLERCWRAQPLPAIANAFGALVEEPPLQKLRRMDRLASWHPDHWSTQAVMGELSLDAKLWGQARKYLTAAARRPTAGILSLLAKLEVAEYQNQQAAQKWLSTTPAADPDWRCGQCAGHLSGWHLFCPRCGALDSLTWTGDPIKHRSVKVGASPLPEPKTRRFGRRKSDRPTPPDSAPPGPRPAVPPNR